MKFRIINSDQKIIWKRAVNKLPEFLKDIHFTYEYMEIHKDTYGLNCKLLVAEDGSDIVLQPLILKTIYDTGLSDISSLYGYGNAIGNNPFNERLRKYFEQKKVVYLKKASVVSEFGLINPIFFNSQKNFISDKGDLKFKKRVIVINLTQDSRILWSAIKDSQRKAAKSAQNKGVVIEHLEANEENIGEFNKMYYGTMSRVGAKKFWFFPKNYFEKTAKVLGTKNILLFGANYAGRYIAYFLILKKFDIAYYHFSCGLEEFSHLNANSILMINSILYLKAAGAKLFHLGGGFTNSNDKLFKFKKSFSNSMLDLYATERILEPKLYKYLTDKFLNGLDNNIQSVEYFPLYRYDVN